ncbi:hypothetical protein AAEY33_05535 [Peribacillus simplex]|uniref:hypothetical protein n=1 Tax=Peribacillus simplex TaxID=1478 RepID=UPI0032656B50
MTRGTLIYDGKNIFSSNVPLAGTKVPPRIGKVNTTHHLEAECNYSATKNQPLKWLVFG